METMTVWSLTTLVNLICVYVYGSRVFLFTIKSSCDVGLEEVTYSTKRCVTSKVMKCINTSRYNKEKKEGKEKFNNVISGRSVLFSRVTIR